MDVIFTKQDLIRCLDDTIGKEHYSIEFFYDGFQHVDITISFFMFFEALEAIRYIDEHKMLMIIVNYKIGRVD